MVRARMAWPMIMEASVLHGGRIPLKEGTVAALGAIVLIGSGASVGREGPVVHIGASLASWVGQGLKLSRSLSLTLLGCSVAAAVAGFIQCTDSWRLLRA